MRILTVMLAAAGIVACQPTEQAEPAATEPAVESHASANHLATALDA